MSDIGPENLYFKNLARPPWISIFITNTYDGTFLF